MYLINVNEASAGLILVPPTTLLAATPIADFSETEIIVNSSIGTVLNELLFNVSFAAFHATEMTEQMELEEDGVASIYKYGNRKRLWIPYSVGLGIALANIVIGVTAAHRNRGVVENGFLQTVVATRNRELEVLSRNGSLGRIPRKLEGAHLKLGTVDGKLTFHTPKP